MCYLITSVGHLDHVLIVYSWMEHVTWKSPGPTCGWVGRILHSDSCTSVSSWSKVPLLTTWSVSVPLCRPLLPCASWRHGSLPRHDLWWLTCELHCSPLPWRLGSVCVRVYGCESSMERKFLDFSLPGSECFTERKFHGSESSLYGLFAPGNESAEERKGQIPWDQQLEVRWLRKLWLGVEKSRIL